MDNRKSRIVGVLLATIIVTCCIGCGTAVASSATDLNIDDIEVFDTEPVIGQQYHVLDVCRAVGHGVYYYTSVMEDANGNRIVVDLSAGDGSGVGNDRSKAIRKHNWIITTGDTVIYRGDQVFDIVKEEQN